MGRNHHQRFFTRYPRLSLALFLLLVFIILDIVAGLLFIPENPNQFRKYHPYYHHDLKPIVSAKTTWDAINYYRFCTNSLGFRDVSDRLISLETGKTRILLIGDSHTEGVGLEFDETFAGRLISMTDTNRFEILNAGVVSYSPKLYYLKTKFLIEQTGLKFDHLLVFIDISDIQNELAYEDFKPGDKVNLDIRLHQLNTFLRDHSFTWYSIQFFREKQKIEAFYKNANRQVKNPKTDLYSTFFSDFNNQEILRDKAFHDIGSWYLNNEIFEKWGRRGLTLESEYMQKLVQLCRDNDIEISISIHPWPVQIKYGDVNSIQVQFWSEFARQQQIGLINLFPVFFEMNKEINVISECYQKGDVHWNAKGSEIAAEKILMYLKDNYPQIERK